MKLSLSAVIIIICSYFGNAQPLQINISIFEAKEIANNFINGYNSKNEADYRILNSIILEENQEPIAFLHDLFPKGFIIVSLYRETQPIIGYSFENNFYSKYEDNSVLVFSLINGISLSDKNNLNLASQKEFKIYDPIYQIGPFLDCVYGQVNCLDINASQIYPTNYYTPNHYAPGCVAISFLKMMKYYEWPNKGLGIHQYIDSYGNSTGTYGVNFEEETYDWDNVLSEYKFVSSTEEEQEAIGKITFHAAVSINMDFENTGSSSNVNRIPDAGKEYFSYTSKYKSFSSSLFWSSLDSNVINQIPSTLAISAANGAGHSCVVDGIKMEDDSTMYYHLNLGWWGSANGWYRIKDYFNAGGYNAITGGVFDFIPKPFFEKPVKLPNSNMYKLKWDISNHVQVDEYELRGKINNGLWHIIETDGITDSLIVEVGEFDNYYYKVKAKINGEWIPNSWSNIVKAEESTSINNLLLNQIDLFPNPTDDIINIAFADELVTKEKELMLFDISGDVIFTQTAKKGLYNSNISLKNLEKGIYILKVSTKKNSVVLKVIKI